MKNVHIVVSSPGRNEPDYDVLKLGIPDKDVKNFIANFLSDTPASAPASQVITKEIPHQPYNGDDNFLYKTIIAILNGFAIGVWNFDGDKAEKKKKVVKDGMENRIRAIKAIRALSGLGLKEAKDLVEAAISWENHEKSEAFEKN